MAVLQERYGIISKVPRLIKIFIPLITMLYFGTNCFVILPHTFYHLLSMVLLSITILILGVNPIFEIKIFRDPEIILLSNYIRGPTIIKFEPAKNKNIF